MIWRQLLVFPMTRLRLTTKTTSITSMSGLVLCLRNRWRLDILYKYEDSKVPKQHNIK
jgi:hypothetical protein